ncbi:5-(carboxyamino)imidazole ribonucleotide synthase [Piscirickettsia litoralis]|uniref:N5-carboxyaminoimidazole ribonucleotide synthase n=1 Tax=Piscirickettsia litoralis TaxID=1891921 RepID=A0ABX3A6M1_9GAMM|nr:5-(carboxyamino)imidazole ribonucleotide synthase [Piscirickettsia litoralis]ODN43090.1 5-(carboxyamino)imidazole ribonucleotide synthase [Piscirickettsia litoralis]
MKTLGVLGGGQLARMMALAGYPLGIKVIAYEPTDANSASDVTEVMRGRFDDEVKLKEFAQSVDVVTIETENIPVDTARYVSQFAKFCPSLQALEIAQDRLLEKQYLNKLNIKTTEFMDITSESDLSVGVEKLGLPCVLKTRRFGYDGKGQYWLRHQEDIAKAWQQLGGQPLILEAAIDFDFEISVIGVRDAQGNIKVYPITENEHRDGVLHISKVLDNQNLQQQASDHIQSLMSHLNYVGVLTVELFSMRGELIANEIAPRVHNSGHWTIDGAVTSQFENHLRAVLGLSLGDVGCRGHAAMMNCLGAMPKLDTVLAASSQARYHCYGKSARAGRKVGHINLCVDSATTLSEQLQRLEATTF